MIQVRMRELLEAGVHFGSSAASRHLRSRRPIRLVEIAVKGMLPKNRLGRQLYRKLKVYAGPDHPHQSQQPAVLEIES